MLHRLRIAALLSLSLTAACASGIDSKSSALDTGDVLDQTESCFRTFGDFDGDLTPPTVGIPVGDNEVSAQDAIKSGQDFPSDPRSALLAEYATAILNADAGADLREYEVDLLISADTLLAKTASAPELELDLAEDMLEVISLLSELNTGLSLEVPCLESAADVLNQAPLVPQKPDVTGPRERSDKGLFTGTASPEAPTLPRTPRPKRPAAE